MRVRGKLLLTTGRLENNEEATIELTLQELAGQLTNSDIQELVELTIKSRGLESKLMSASPKPQPSDLREKVVDVLVEWGISEDKDYTPTERLKIADQILALLPQEKPQPKQKIKPIEIEQIIYEHSLSDDDKYKKILEILNWRL